MRFLYVSFLAGSALMLASQGAGLAQEPKVAASGVAVTVTYKGAGTVDRGHEIWIFLFDTPDMAGRRPIATLMLDKNGATATFKAVEANPVYVAVAFDQRGDYDGNEGPPPPGTPVAAYAIEDAKAPSPVKVGEGISMTFDDTNRM